MPSSLAHALVAGAVGTAFANQNPPRRYWIAGVACAVLPDIDAIGRPFGRGDLEFLGGHRAVTHSMLFAVALGTLVAWSMCWRYKSRSEFPRLAIYLSAATASHGLLDLLAPYGEGVELFAPISMHRYMLPWRPLDFSGEILWVWLPAVAVILLGYWYRKRARRERAEVGSVRL